MPVDDPFSLQSELIEHRLRNLLTVIITNLDMLERTAHDRTATRRLALIRTAAVGGLDLIGASRRSPREGDGG